MSVAARMGRIWASDLFYRRGRRLDTAKPPMVAGEECRSLDSLRSLGMTAAELRAPARVRLLDSTAGYVRTRLASEAPCRDDPR